MSDRTPLLTIQMVKTTEITEFEGQFGRGSILMSPIGRLYEVVRKDDFLGRTRLVEVAARRRLFWTVYRPLDHRVTRETWDLVETGWRVIRK